MKQRNSLALVVVLGLFFLQNTYSEEIRARTNKCTFALADGCPIVYDDSSTNRYVLWRIYTPNTYDSQSKVKVDSVLRENFYAKEEWSLHYYKMESTPKGEYKRHKEKLNLIPNTYYLVLATADCSTKNAAKGTCRLLLTTKDNFLPDTPKNRALLSKKRDETKVTYEN
jgi:hypothetical protein